MAVVYLLFTWLSRIVHSGHMPFMLAHMQLVIAQ